MNTRLRTFAPIIVLAVIAVVVVMLSGPLVMLAAQSPVPSRSPLPTPFPTTQNDEERECLYQCLIIEDLTGIECYARCVPLDGSLDTAVSVPTSTPSPTPTPAFCPSWWQELPPWMGLYELRTNGAEYCIGARLY